MSSLALSFLIAAAASTTNVPVGPPEGAFDPPPSIRHQLEEAEQKQAAFEAFSRVRGRDSDVKSWASALPPLAFDVERYEIDVHVNPSRELLSGSVTSVIRAVEDGLSAVELDADLGLRILSVMQVATEPNSYDTPRALSFEHRGDVLRVTLAQPLRSGEQVQLQITYGGHAERDGLIGSTGVNWFSTGGTPVIHTFAQPYGARVWWPCNDRPDDKALVSLRITVPGDLDVASNGTETSREDNGDGTATSHWSSRYPVPTYLVVMHISDFVYSESTYEGLDGTTMPVGLWTLPQVAAQAESDLAVTVPQIEVMAEHWGEYPFLEEKYGNATVFFGGGMEHQTMTTLTVNSVGDPWMEWLNVHELGHQWWGDWVTMDDWRHIWLNEGFATHTEWLWAEHQGPAVLAGYLVDEDWRGWFSGPVYDNPEPFSWTIYAKGSWVVWMLRHVIGDEVFFDAMAAYREAHAGATATTEDLRQVMEAASGMELGWFFDQWVYGVYRPRYIYEWENIDGPAVALTVRQVQTNTGLFRMPMTVRVATPSGSEDHRVWLEAEAEQTVEIALQTPATAVILNPDTHVLCDVAHVSEPDLDLGPDVPDNFDFGLLPGSAHATRELPLTNVGGADLVVQGIWLNEGISFNLVDLPQFPFTIAPGETHTVEILADPSGNGRRTDWVLVQSNDPDRDGVAFVALAATGTLYDDALLAVPASRSIGSVPLGGTAEIAFDAVNVGGQPLAVTTTVEGEGFFLGGVVPPVLAPGTSTPIYVRFHPAAIGSATGSVVFSAGDPTDPIKTVRLSATGQGAPRLDLDPPALTLGIGGYSTTATVRLRNTGDDTLWISTIRVPAPYRLVDAPDLPTQIPAGSSLPVEVAVELGADGTHWSHLTIHSNDPAVPVARVPLRAHITTDQVYPSSFPAAASGPGLDNTTWRSRAYLVNFTDETILTDLVFRPGGVRSSDQPDAGIEILPGRQRVIDDLVASTGASGTGGVSLRSTRSGLLAVSRTYASGAGGSYGQFIAGSPDSAAQRGSERFLLAGLDGNGGFHTNLGVLNLGDEAMTLDTWFHDAAGTLLGTRRIVAQPHAFAQVVAVIGKLTDEVVRGGYATVTAADPQSLYLVYASVVDDASHDPTLVVPQLIGESTIAEDIVIPSVASLHGAAGTIWRSRVDVVNVASEERAVTLEYVRSDGSSITSMAMLVAAGESLRFDDVVDGLFGEQGKGWLLVTPSGPGVHATSRTYNDDPTGTYGQLVPASEVQRAATSAMKVLLPGLSSQDGFRCNIGLTSLASEATDCTVSVHAGDGTSLGEIATELPARSFVQLERILADGLGYSGEAWAEIRCDAGSALYLAHASVVDGTTGDPTYIPGTVIYDGP